MSNSWGGERPHIGTEVVWRSLDVIVADGLRSWWRGVRRTLFQAGLFKI